ncbi:MAG: hypothetical protein JWQ97_2955 [Phenylobacterium sp.]|nr:hypothetical protein [Phenylobacterium sp.]
MIIPHARRAARRLGYALAVHGSLERDIDLIAVPWTVDAAPPEKLAELIRRVAARCRGPRGLAFQIDQDPNPTVFAHRRLAWSFHLGGGPYIDLSVIAPSPHQEGNEWGEEAHEISVRHHANPRMKRVR